ncbi:MAG: class I tRNA ligase family protein, partial [Planctomycetes bacterium]|nr:class I tRNA ligase family protein [Planctomycetota bacterium]
QRSWGVPIPAFYCGKCDEVLLTAESVKAVRDVFARHGADSWFYRPLADFLPNGAKCPKCGSAEFRRESDIFDVWFESGSSHHSVLTKRGELTFPCDMYLEGSDQHRGWFQLSLLPSLGAHGCAPFRTVLTHGFVVDEKGEKMSKSLGNFISVGDALKQFGGDVIRLWTSSLDYRSDMNVSRDLINRMSDAYRRIRNTFRYLLGNLADFNPKTDSVAYADMLEIDRWALHETQKMVAAVTDAFETLELHRVYVAIHNFCAVEMSAFYLDILKDRLYTFGKTSRERHAAQTALHHVLLTLVKLSAPVIVHTADEAWGFIEHKDEDVPSVHLARWPEPRKEWMDDALAERWDTLIRVRSEVARELEKLRAAKTIGSSLEATVTLYVTDDKLFSLLSRYANDLQMIFINSDVTLVKGESAEAVKAVEMPGLAVLTKPSPHKKCARCWNYRANVGADAEHPALCSRCVGVIRQM